MTEALLPSNPHEEYERVVGFVPEALFILSGGVKKVINDQGEARFLPTTYADSDKYGMLGGEARVKAAAQIADIFPQIPIYTLSQNEAIDQISWKVYAQSLVENGVSPNRVISIPNSLTTIDEILQIVQESVRLNLSKVAIMTNDYHIARAGLIVDVLEYFVKDDEEALILNDFRQKGIDIRFIPAERILEIKDPEFAEYYKGIKETPEAVKRFENEYRGAYRLITDPASYINGIGLGGQVNLGS